MVSKAKKSLALSFNVGDLQTLRAKLAYRDASVDSVEIMYGLSYLTPDERITLVNELHRVMKPGAKCQITSPHWSCNRAYADLRFVWPPVAESWYFSLDAEYRKLDANHDGRYKCDFSAVWGYSMHPLLHTRNTEYQQHAITFWKEAAQDLIATITKK